MLCLMLAAPYAVAAAPPRNCAVDADGVPKMTSFLAEDLDEVLELSD